MRKVRYQVACSLDGFIAGPEDDFDWITPEPTFDFEELYGQFDTLVMGRRTYEIVSGSGEGFRGKEVIVASRSLEAAAHAEVEVVREDLENRIRQLRGEAGRDIWLYGGGELFSQVLRWGLVDTVEPAIIPILLGSGVPLLPSPAVQRRLKLVDNRSYPSGMVLLEYEVLNLPNDVRGSRVPPGNRLEALKGDRAGEQSIRINRRYRICFRWRDGAARDVEITDYHP